MYICSKKHLSAVAFYRVECRKFIQFLFLHFIFGQIIANDLNNLN